MFSITDPALPRSTGGKPEIVPAQKVSLFTVRFLTVGVPSLLNHIAGVICLGSQEQVRWIDAGAIIAMV